MPKNKEDYMLKEKFLKWVKEELKEVDVAYNEALDDIEEYCWENCECTYGSVYELMVEDAEQNRYDEIARIVEYARNRGISETEIFAVIRSVEEA